MAEYDLVMRGGTVADGTGTGTREADVAIKDGKIAAVGMVAGNGARGDRRQGPAGHAGLRRHPHPL